MVCPKCGYNNPDNAAQCSNCYYKFRFGHAYNDPKYMTFISVGNAKNSKSVRYIFISIFLLVFILIIASWFNAI